MDNHFDPDGQPGLDAASETVSEYNRRQFGDEFATTLQSAESPAVPWSLLLSSSQGFPIRFGRYQVLGRLGEGSMGAVYLACDTQLDRQVALKIAKFDERSDRAAIQRFYREARAMATLRHPNLCPVYDLGESDGTYFLTMAYIEGNTLASRLENGEAIPARQVALLIRKLALALQEAHQADVVHRDLKPANIIVDRSDEPVIMDFGLAAMNDCQARLTHAGSMIGTPAYMAPEQVTGDLAAIGPASDIYSLGVIMYQLLTGRLPFQGSVVSVVTQSVSSEPLAPSQINAEVDARLETICLKALAKRPEDRYGSALEMANALRDFLVNRRPAAKPATSTQPPPTPEEQASHVRALWGCGEFSAALSILESMSKLTDPSAVKHADWARQQLPEARAKCDAQRSAVGERKSEQIVANAAAVEAPYLLPVVTASRRGLDKTSRWLPVILALPVIVIALIVALFVTTNRGDRWTPDEPPDPTPVTTGPGGTGFNDSMALETRGSRPELGTDGRVVTEAGQPRARPEFTGPEFAGPPRHDGRPRGPAPERSRGPPPPRPADELLRDLDRNADDRLSLNELPRHVRPHLMRADFNGDGILTWEELQEFYLLSTGPPPEGPRPPRR